MGLDDTYLFQAERNDIYWAWRNSQGLEYTFEYNIEQKSVTTINPEHSDNNVKADQKLWVMMVPKELFIISKGLLPN